jgi:ATP-dependent helicase/nuclease subunit A
VEVIWPREGGCEFKLRKDIQTGDFDTVKPIDEQMDYHERIRLLYVACTRARDHLIVSLHRKERQGAPDADSSWTNAELLAGACDGAPSQMPLDTAPGGSGTSSGSRSATQPPRFEDWLRDITRLRERVARPAAMSASQLEGSSLPGVLRPAATDRVGEPADAGLAKDGRTWNFHLGTRGGTGLLSGARSMACCRPWTWPPGRGSTMRWPLRFWPKGWRSMAGSWGS